jgi:nucleotide-binding universal stress UspA family protein
MFRHLLVPTDGSELSAAALRAAAAFARDIGARITVFHVRQSVLNRTDLALYGDPLVLDPRLVEQFNRAETHRAESLLSEARSLAQQEGVSCATDSSEEPIIHQAILDAAERHGCDLIFMASHGRRGLAGMLLGSETQRVLSHSSLPVFVFREQPAADLPAAVKD